MTSQSPTDVGGAREAFPRRRVHTAPALLPPRPSFPSLVSPSLPSFFLPPPTPLSAALVSNLEPHRLCCKGGGSSSTRRTEKILYK